MIHDKKQGYRHQANKNRSAEQDIDQKNLVIKELRKLGINAVGLTKNIYLRDKQTSKVTITSEAHMLVTPETFEKYFVRFPDLYVPSKDIIIEIDGSAHGEPGFETDDTLSRNMEYELGGHTIQNGKLIILQVADLDNLESILRERLKID